MTVTDLQRALDTLDEGVLTAGAHRPDASAFCALEFSAAVRGKPPSDAPGDLPDLRPLNDAPWSSDLLRTAHLLPVMAAYWDWGTWSPATQTAVVARVAVLTVNRLIAALPGLSDAVSAQCRSARTLAAAADAARAAVAAAEAWLDGVLAAKAAYGVATLLEERAASVAVWPASAAEAAGEAMAAAAMAARAVAMAAWGVAATSAVAAALVTEAEAVREGDAVLITACQLWIVAIEGLS